MRWQIVLKCPKRVDFPIIEGKSKQDAVREASWMLATDKSLIKEQEDPWWEITEIEEVNDEQNTDDD